MRLVCLSDTHSLHDRVRVPDGDVLIHAGDFCGRGDEENVRRFASWLWAQPHEHKLVIAGNHDEVLERDLALGASVFGDAYLFESGVEIAGVRFWGAPWQPEFCNWAFNLSRGPALAQRWAKIPDGTDVLITHGPPRRVLDKCLDGFFAGCDDLRDAIERVKPKVHVFGHIHEGYGTKRVGSTTFVNASLCTAAYQPTNAPIVVDL